MSDPVSQPQFDLFQAQPAGRRQRGGLPRHVPTPETMLLVNDLKAAGETQVAIARALGIGVSTFEKHYLARNPASQPIGRKRHSPTQETRKVVRRAVLSGMTQAKVAKLIGISVPTLRLHYPNELGQDRLAKRPL